MSRRKPKRRVEKFNTVGVRFITGVKLNAVYTYKVRPSFKPFLGQELVADTDRGPVLVAVVRVDAKPRAGQVYVEDGQDYVGELKYITKKVVNL
jgi:hypothetical protein